MSGGVPAAVIDAHRGRGTAAVGLSGSREEISVDLIEPVEVSDNALINVGFSFAKSGLAFISGLQDAVQEFNPRPNSRSVA